jgi:hypothetical protein
MFQVIVTTLEQGSIYSNNFIANDFKTVVDWLINRYECRVNTKYLPDSKTPTELSLKRFYDAILLGDDVQETRIQFQAILNDDIHPIFELHYCSNIEVLSRLNVIIEDYISCIHKHKTMEYSLLRCITRDLREKNKGSDYIQRFLERLLKEEE